MNLLLMFIRALAMTQGTRASNQIWVSNAVITGKDIPRLLPIKTN